MVIENQNQSFDAKYINMKTILLVIALICPVMLGSVMLPGKAMILAVSSGSASPVEIKIDNFTFTPNTVSVPVGTEVRWTNHDDIPHTVVSDDKAIKSKVLDTDEQFTYKFTKAGTYNYFCSIHPKMTAKVVVQ